MKIRDILAQGKVTLSFEVFPPKKADDLDSVIAVAARIAELRPSFMSVTYGAGGGTSEFTVRIAKSIADTGVTPLAHLTCYSSTKEKVDQVLQELKENDIENILALRGDIPEDGQTPGVYHHASELIAEIRAHGDFCIGGACYPEGHPEAPNRAADIDYIKEKVNAGCDFLTTQMFFDNSIYYSYVCRLLQKGITVPVLAGIMPITTRSQVARAIKLSGCVMPSRFLSLVDRYGDNPKAMKQAGIAYATEQIIDLLSNGVRGIHIYSMNKPDVAEKICENISELIR